LIKISIYSLLIQVVTIFMKLDYEFAMMESVFATNKYCID